MIDTGCIPYLLFRFSITNSLIVKRVIIIGAGPAGLMAATQLAGSDAEVVIVDHKAAAGRKFLVAGDGGFNLTHSENLETFVAKYDRPLVRDWVRHYPPEAFRAWLTAIGIETFVGSSGKVFPLPEIKPIQVLNAWLKQLQQPAISWKLRTRLVDFDENKVVLQTAVGEETLVYDFLVIALGGASWKKTGSDGTWYELFEQKHISLKPFGASNSGLELEQTAFLSSCEGSVIKNVRLSHGETTVAGDLVLTHYGIEGKPAYAMNNPLRKNDFKGLTIDFKPQLTCEHLAEVLSGSKTIRAGFERLKIALPVYTWLKATLTKEQFTDSQQLAQQLKTFAPQLKGLRPLDEVISTVGGVDMDAIHPDGSLKQFPNVYCAGEMLDWDAPTGGYLLQGCVSSGYTVGKTIKWRMEH